MNRTTTVCVALALFLAGCMIPPIVFPPTRVHGVVLDQDNNPVTNVTLEASSEPPRLNFWFTPTVTHHFKADKYGRWRYTERKVGRLFIEAMKPLGYDTYYRPEDGENGALIGPFSDGDCPTNEYALRLRKLSPEEFAAAEKQRMEYEQVIREKMIERGANTPINPVKVQKR